MKITFIWDLDGTLLDSYPLIVNSLWTIYKEKGVLMDKKEIYEQVINESVSAFIKAMEERFNIPFDDLKDRYSNITHKELLSIKAMPHSKEILDYLRHLLKYVFPSFQQTIFSHCVSHLANSSTISSSYFISHL